MIPLERLCLILLPIAAVALVWWRWCEPPKQLGIAVARMVVQLLAVGYVLVFLFENRHPAIGFGVIAFMVAVSSAIAVRTMGKGKKGRGFLDAVVSIGIAGCLVLALVLVGVLDLDPLYQPDKIIPLAGMIFSTAMTAITLCADRFEAERETGRPAEECRGIAWKTALIPQVNSFLAVGLVALPGMMTGQILAGASPLDAVRYQIMVMGMILGSAGLASALFLTLVVRREGAPQMAG